MQQEDPAHLPAMAHVRDIDIDIDHLVLRVVDLDRMLDRSSSTAPRV